MSRGLSNASGNGSGFRGLRDYGATSTGNVPMAGTSGMAAGSDVTFAGFSPTEFMSLSENIAQNIGSVKSSWHHLEKIIKIIGGPKDTAAIRDKVWVEIFLKWIVLFIFIYNLFGILWQTPNSIVSKFKDYHNK